MGAQQGACCKGANQDGSDLAAAMDAPVQYSKEEIEAPLSSAEVTLVQKTWATAAGLGVETVGTILFKHIFTIAPEALALFSFRSEPNILAFTSPKLKAHGVKVVTTVGVAVDGLTNLEALVPVLQALAVKHVGYGVLPPHYDVVGKALMNTLQDGLKAGFTPGARLAWSKVWHIIAKTMIAAANEVAPKKEAAEAAPLLTPEEIGLVQGSWNKAAGALGAEAVGVLLFKHIFEIAPEALQLFPFKDEADLYESSALKAHGVKVVTTVGTAVGSLEQLGALVPVLQALGKKHVGYGVLPPHYDVVGKAVLMTLKAGLKDDFTAEHEAAWGKVYGIVATTMIGDHYA